MVESRTDRQRSRTPYNTATHQLYLIIFPPKYTIKNRRSKGEGYPPTKIIKQIMKKDNHNNAFPGSSCPSPILYSSQSNPRRKRTTHAGSRSEKQRPATDTVDEESEYDCFDPVCCADDAVESVLELRVGDSYVGENFALRQ